MDDGRLEAPVMPIGDCRAAIMPCSRECLRRLPRRCADGAEGGEIIEAALADSGRRLRSRAEEG